MTLSVIYPGGAQLRSIIESCVGSDFQTKLSNVVCVKFTLTNLFIVAINPTLSLARFQENIECPLVNEFFNLAQCTEKTHSAGDANKMHFNEL